MPTIRYNLRNEYGLGNSDLYRTADKDDPEAVLDGVGMAGLVGLLRQLGDLAELAADIFHDLHEEITNTSSRGHGMMLRIKQLETELPLLEKSILAQPTYSHFSYSEGMEWHGNLRIGQNLVTGGDMPHFVMNSYEECRGPPKLFMLDKFDVSGDGACLKRYTDPSIYRMTSLATLVEEEAQMERQACKTKKKPHLRETETPQSSISEDSRLEPTPGRDSDEAKSTDARLKSRKFNENGSCIRNYMEHILEIHSLEAKLVSEPSLNNHMTSTESVIEVRDIAIDASTNIARSRRSSLGKDEMTMPAAIYESDKQMEKKNDMKKSPVKATVHFSKVSAKCSKADKRRLLLDDGNKIDVHLDHCPWSEKILDIPLPQEVDQNGFLADADTITEESSDGFLSDDFSSEMDNYADALTTMDSETEVDHRSKPDLCSFNGDTQEMNYDHNEEELESEAQLCEQQSLANSTESPGFSTLFRKGVANPSFSDALGNLAAQLLEEKRTNSTSPLISNLHQIENGADAKASDNSRYRFRSSEIHPDIRITDATCRPSRLHSPSSFYWKPLVIAANDQEGTTSDDPVISQKTIEKSSDAKASDSAIVCVSLSEERYPSTDSDFEEIKEQESKKLNHTSCNQIKPLTVQGTDDKYLVDRVNNLSKTSASEYCFDSKNYVQYSGSSSPQHHAAAANLCEGISDLVVDKEDVIICSEQCGSLPASSMNRSGKLSSVKNKLFNTSKETQAIVASDELGESDMSNLASPVEDDKVVYGNEAFVESTVQPTGTLTPSESTSSPYTPLPKDNSQHLTVSNCTLDTEDQISKIVQSPPSVEIETSQNPVASSDREIPQSQISFQTESPAEGNLNPSPSHLNTGLPPLPPPLLKNPHSALNRPRDALIEAVAAHDKSQLRKAPELFRSPAMPKLDERRSFLEQIRNKSFSLKPAALAAPSLKLKGGPPTNLKVIAILEKANAIRQACAGSDDEDGDSWSDS